MLKFLWSSAFSRSWRHLASMLTYLQYCWDSLSSTFFLGQWWHHWWQTYKIWLIFFLCFTDDQSCHPEWLQLLQEDAEPHEDQQRTGEKLHFQQLQSLSFYFTWLTARRVVRYRSNPAASSLICCQTRTFTDFFFPSQSNSLKKKKNLRNKITQRKRQSGERENRYRWSSSSTDERQLLVRLWAADSLRPLAQSHISLTLSHDSLFP